MIMNQMQEVILDKMKVKQTKENTIEKYSLWWFNELKDHGYIKEIFREPETLYCADKEKYYRLKRFKRKDPEVEEFNLFGEIKYTYDYKIIWDLKARYIFYDVIDKNDDKALFKQGKPLLIANYDYDKDGNEIHVTRLDVKPTASVARFGKTSTQISFPIKQRMIYDRYGIYIQKFIPIPMAGSGKTSSVFPKSFTPRRYLMTDGGKQLRKIRFVVKGLQEYVKLKISEL